MHQVSSMRIHTGRIKKNKVIFSNNTFHNGSRKRKEHLVFSHLYENSSIVPVAYKGEYRLSQFFFRIFE